ncbi:hypothetical protein [Flavobacterium chilense]|uniref:SPASM domain peptide maturase, grasp-with-spasm system n=1 Tax=Flavobacterium chilense TaxID=946677 RepID=A0A1M7MWL2_9FLAO|nr:hypothetical protein [Flavobacterium chilense]SHM95453.1 SPASM domain peptide maturase, grasp-with-spasm system [Flavobacterium chilense]
MYFFLYSHNVIVSGKDKAAIYDLQHVRIMYIPNAFVSVLEKLQIMSVEQLKDLFFQNNQDILDQYLVKLTENKMGRYVQDIECFPKLDFSYHFPGTIHSAVVETDLEKYDPFPVIDDLDRLGCRHLELRVKISSKQLNRFNMLLNVLEENITQSLDIFWEFDASVTEKEVETIYNIFQKINSIVVHGASEEKKMTAVMFRKASLKELEKEGMNTDKHILDMKYYCESLAYNTTYHQKVAIDYLGDIKNIIFDKNSYGNVNHDNLINVVNTDEFQKFWEITADQIEEIKDSPLRHAIYNPFPIYEKNGKYYINYLNQ